MHLQTCYPWLDLEGVNGVQTLPLYGYIYRHVTHGAHCLHNVINHNNAFLPPANSLKCYSRLQLTT